MVIPQLFEHLMKQPCFSCEKLNGSRTNNSYRIVSANGQYVLRIPGEGTNEYINRAHEIYNLQKVKKLGFVPELFYANPDTGILVMKYIEDGAPMTRADLKDQKRLRQMCRSLVELHTSNIQMANEFDLIETKNRYIGLLDNMGVQLPDAVKEQMPALEDLMTKLMREYPKELVPCHGDTRVENFLMHGEELWLIDWEYSGMADICFDLINDLVGEEEKAFLEEYQRCSGKKLDKRKYILYKIATDYMWIFWHLIKLNQMQMVDYNEFSWRNRLERACRNMYALGAIT